MTRLAPSDLRDPSAAPDAASPRRLAALIDAAEVVSFDFFDTLFVRPLCDPEDAFDILARRLHLPDFRQRRRAAQVEAFRRMHKEGRREISLEDIYACWGECEVAADVAMRHEYELELELVHPNAEVVEQFQRALELRKRVVITSDMYLPGRFFREALARHALPDVPLFISADRDATKRDAGELFELLAKETGVATDRILHIGDNPVSDVERAAGKGLAVFHYRPPGLLPALDQPSLDASFALGQLRESTGQVAPGSLRELGFLYGGPAALGYLEWIARWAARDQIDRVFFLARDGFILERLARSAPPELLPRSTYFLGSRIAFTLAAITEANFREHLGFLLSGAEGLSPAELLERIDVPVPDAAVMRDLGLGPDLIIGPSNRALAARFLFAWRWEILKVCRRNRRALFGYLRSLGVASGDRIAVVDVGWNGTTQEAFEKAIRPMFDVEVHGYYLCLADTPERRERQRRHRMTAMISAPLVSEETIANLYANRVVAEVFFSAPHDTVIGLRPSAEGVVPINDRGRAEVDVLPEKVLEIIQSEELFADRFRRARSRLGLSTSPLNMVQPFIEFISQGKWTQHRDLTQIRNFDAWASSRNRDQLMADYVVPPPARAKA